MNSLIQIQENHKIITDKINELLGKYLNDVDNMTVGEVKERQLKIINAIDKVIMITEFETQNCDNWEYSSTFEVLSIKPIGENKKITQDEFEKIKSELEKMFPGSYIRHDRYDYYSTLVTKCVLDNLEM